MQNYWYEWLSIQDNDFLLWETPALPMHGSGISIFAGGALATEDCGIDFAAIKRLMGSILHHVPRYRQKIVWAPGEQRWNSQIASGPLEQLWLDRDFLAASCIESLVFRDEWEGNSASGSSWWLVRSANSCGASTWGEGSSGPAPRNGLDSGPCP